MISWKQDVVKQKSEIISDFAFYSPLGGEGGIRTPGTSRYAGFQDQCIRPLCHFSVGKDKVFFYSDNLIPKKNLKKMLNDSFSER